MFKSVLVILCLVFSVLVNASPDALKYIAASVKESRMSLDRQIKFPSKYAKSDEDVAVVVRCDAFLKRSGKVSANMCYEGGDFYYPFVTAINRAARKAVFKPGRVNGTPRQVYFQYYVLFQKQGKSTKVEVVGNSGLEVEKYGVNYSSPQRYREASGVFGSGCGFNKKIVVNAVISSDGAAKAVDIEGEKLGNACINNLIKAFKGQKYIPALVNGEPVTSFYSERIFNTMRFQ